MIKLKSIARRDMGCVRMETSNKENNSMHGFNFGLGFESASALVEYPKTL